MSVVIPAFYAQNTAADLSAIALGLFLARMLEVVSDPFIGHASDVVWTKTGSRKPGMIAGAILAPVAFVFLFNPPAAADGVYFTVWSMAVYLAWTLINIAYRAWAVELSRDYDERSRIFTNLGLAQGLGAIVFALSPFLPFFSTSEISPKNLGAIGWVLALGLPAAILCAVKWAPSGQAVAGERPTWRDLVQAVRSNRPLQWFLLAYLLGGVAQAMFLACFYFYVDAFMGLGAHFALSLLIVYVAAFASIPLWLWIMRHFSKRRAWALGWGLLAVLGLAFIFIPRGEDGLVIFLIIAGLYGVGSVVEVFAPLAVLGDVIDYDTWKTRVNRAGIYNAISAFVQKANIALGGALAFWLLDIGGFDARSSDHDEASVRTFFLTFAVLPAIGYVLSLWALAQFPLDRRRQDILRRRMLRRAPA